jgi:hypothetical protein
MQQPSADKVLEVAPGVFSPQLVYMKGQMKAPLGEYTSREAAQCAFDVGKMLVRPRRLCIAARLRLPLAVLASQSEPLPASLAAHYVRPQLALKVLGAQMQQVALFKLHLPIATYTAHPLWGQMVGPHCSFEDACSLLAGGLAADFLQPAPNAPSRQLRAAKSCASAAGGPVAASAAAAALQQAQRRSAAAGTPQQQQQKQQKQDLRRARWLEYPARSQQYATAISARAIRSQTLLVPGDAWPALWHHTLLLLLLLLLARSTLL